MSSVIVVCAKCCILDEVGRVNHVGHRCVPVEKGTAQKKAALQASRASTEHLTADLKVAETLVESTIAQVQQQGGQCQLQIKSAFEHIRRETTAREVVMLKELDKVVKIKIATLNDQQDLLHTARASMQKAVARAVTAAGDQTV